MRGVSMRSVLLTRAGALVVGLLGLGCGDDDSGAQAGGFSGIQSALTEPTGMVDVDTAPAIAEEYDRIAIGAGSAGGQRYTSEQFPQERSVTQTVSCPAGGGYTVSGSGSETGGEATVAYENCCYQDACCMSGSGTWFFSQDANTANYTYCGSYSLAMECMGFTENVAYEGCFGMDGRWTYVVEVEGQTFAVAAEGSYYGGEGTLTVTGANGTFVCTYSDGTGSCSGDGSFSF